MTPNAYSIPHRGKGCAIFTQHVVGNGTFQLIIINLAVLLYLVLKYASREQNFNTQPFTSDDLHKLCPEKIYAYNFRCWALLLQ